ncbi:MAG: TIGR02444 family protein [Alphaproteobacteria bacterium]|nr:TIGR02444 family protein [Alphaproteobacteria bacterium]
MASIANSPDAVSADAHLPHGLVDGPAHCGAKAGPPMAVDSDGLVWSFARRIYGGAGVAQACLELQARHGVDMDLLLYAAWFGASGRGRLSAAEFDRLRAESAAWHADIVLALRSLRRRLKTACHPVSADAAAGLARRILDCEIEAERLALEAMGERLTANAHRPERERRADAEANVEACLSRFRVGPVDQADRTDLATILAACFC